MGLGLEVLAAKLYALSTYTTDSRVGGVGVPRQKQ